jgi:hypothetical protein
MQVLVLIFLSERPARRAYLATVVLPSIGSDVFILYMQLILFALPHIVEWSSNWLLRTIKMASSGINTVYVVIWEYRKRFIFKSS